MTAVDPSARPTAGAAVRRRWTPELLLDTAFRRYWTGQSISVLGDQVSALALPLIAVVALHADATRMGFLTAAIWLPNLLFALHAGAWADRRGRRRRTMIATDLGRAALVATLPLGYALHALTLTQLYVVAFATGTLSVLFDVSRAPLFQALVPAGRYVEGSSLVSGSSAMAQVLGPGLGGLLVQLLSAPLALLADALSFVASALCLSRISPAEPPPTPGGRGGLTAGRRFIAGSSVMRAALAATATVNFFTFMANALFVLYAIGTLHLSAGLLGAVLGAGAVGGVVGAVSAGAVARRVGVGRTFLIGLIVFPAPMLLIPAAHGPTPTVLALLFAAEFGSGIGMMWLDIAAGSIFSTVVPPELLSRVTGAYRTVNFGVRPLGSLAGGLLAGAIGLRPTLWLAVAGATASFLWLLPSPLPRLRELPQPGGPAPG